MRKHLKIIAAAIFCGSFGGLALGGADSIIQAKFIRQSPAAGVMTVPNATDQFLGRATSDTLTNKSISGSSNTFSNIPGSALTGLLSGTLPFPGASSLGGVNSLASIAHNWINGLGTDGNLTRSQPACTDLSDATLCNAASTGSGNVVKATSATLVSPTLGAALATSINGFGLSCSATTCSLQIVSGKNPVIDNTLQFAGTDGATLSIGDGNALSALGALTGAANKIPYFTGASAASLITIGTGLNFSGGTLSATTSGATAAAVLTKTSDYPVLVGDFSGYRLLLKANCSSACTMMLPAASNSGYEINIINTGTAVATVATAGSDTFGSTTDTTWTLIPGGSPQASNIFISDGGSQWDGF